MYFFINYEDVQLHLPWLAFSSSMINELLVLTFFLSLESFNCNAQSCSFFTRIKKLDASPYIKQACIASMLVLCILTVFQGYH